MNNTKNRHIEIYAAAVTAIEAAGGVEAVDRSELPERYVIFGDMYKSVIAVTGCHRDTAKRNVAKALRKGRYASMVANGWGGARPGPHPGRPKAITNDKNKGDEK